MYGFFGRMDIVFSVRVGGCSFEVGFVLVLLGRGVAWEWVGLVSVRLGVFVVGGVR